MLEREPVRELRLKKCRSWLAAFRTVKRSRFRAEPDIEGACSTFAQNQAITAAKSGVSQSPS